MARSGAIELVCSAKDEARLAAYADIFHLVSTPSEAGEFHLAFHAGTLMLVRRGDRRGVWVESSEIRRRLQGDFLLGRACGLRRGHPQRILDATAGLGIDGLALALAGAQVHLVERNPVLWALLHNLLERLELPGVELTRGDAGRILAGGMSWDVVYFDPMFPARGKTALPGKRMQYLAALLGDGEAFDQRMLAAAREKATARVVLKRRLKDMPLADPDWTIRGRSVRYDVYRGRGR